jgi:putative copper resistance protein D|tara:strand:+ start:449 stop:1318 length:870 start_codon:yes stop_codon:yes gene_type:complete
MEIWIVLNPIIKFLLYIAVFGSVGTLVFIFHFYRLLTPLQLDYCSSTSQKFTKVGVLVSFISILSIPGNMSGDLIGIIDINMVNLSIDTLALKASLLLFIGFILIYFLPINFKKIFFIGNTLAIFIILFSFIVIGHSTKGGILTQSLVTIHLIGLSYWIGSLLPLKKMCNIADFKELKTITHSFGNYAVFYILALLIAGSIFSFILIGDISNLFNTIYGNVLMIKILFAVLLISLGALNKLFLVPRLDINNATTIIKLKRSINVEMIIVLIIFFLTSLLTTSLTLPMSD